MCWTPDDDKCPNCQYCFKARNQRVCSGCADNGY